MLTDRAGNQMQNQERNPETKDSQCVYVEFCHNCDSHLLTVKHSEHKYVSHYEFVKDYLTSKGISVKKRPTPIELYKQSPYCPPNVYYTHNGDIVHYPRVGSFQVFLGDELIFSKLEHNKWPAPQLIEHQIKQRYNQSNKDIRLSQQPTAEKEVLTSRQAKTIGGDIANKTFHLRWQKKEVQNQRYSLSKRNLLSKSERQNKTARSVNVTSMDKKIEEKEEAEIIKMYSPVPHRNNGVKMEIENLPTLEGKARALKANIYLQPIYPKSRVSYENYQKHKMIFSQKIHEEKLAYDLQKARKEAEEALKFKQHEQQKLKQRQRKLHRPILHRIREATEEEPQLQVNKQQKGIQNKQKKTKNQHNSVINSLELPQIKKEEAEWNSDKHSLQHSKELDKIVKVEKKEGQEKRKEHQDRQNKIAHREKEKDLTNEEKRSKDNTISLNKEQNTIIDTPTNEKETELNKVQDNKELKAEVYEMPVSEEEQKRKTEEEPVEQKEQEKKGGEGSEGEKIVQGKKDKEGKKVNKQQQQDNKEKPESVKEQQKKDPLKEKAQSIHEKQEEKEQHSIQNRQGNETKDEKMEAEQERKNIQQQHYQQGFQEINQEEPQDIPNSEIKVQEEGKKSDHQGLPLESKQIIEKDASKLPEEEAHIKLEQSQHDKLQEEGKNKLQPPLQISS